MKNKALWLLTALSFVMTAAVVSFLPDTVPMHMDAAGNIDRFGSKNEMFIFPLLLLLQSVVWAAVTEHSDMKARTTDDEKTAAQAANNAKILRIVSVCSTLFFLANEIVFLWTAFNFENTGDTGLGGGAEAAVSLLFGAFMVILANFMPKAKSNAVFGLRTHWSMQNDEVWARSQRFGGAVMFVCGTLIMMSAFFTNGVFAVLVVFILVSAALLISVIGSQIIYSKWEKEQKNG